MTALGGASFTYGAAGDRLNAGLTTGDLYDAERRLVSWTAGATTGKEAYDGEGHRIAHQTTSAGTTTTTYYLGGLEEVTQSGGTTTLTKYYGAGSGLPAAVKVGTALSFLAGDGLGSPTVALDANGNVAGQQLYAPYGGVRYASGTMPTDYGFTGQRADAATGLDFYNARYYDPAAGQFASADTVLAGGLNRYAYVGDSPENATDPSGHRECENCGDDGVPASTFSADDLVTAVAVVGLLWEGYRIITGTDVPAVTAQYSLPGGGGTQVLSTDGSGQVTVATTTGQGTTLAGYNPTDPGYWAYIQRIDAAFGPPRSPSTSVPTPPPPPPPQSSLLLSFSQGGRPGAGHRAAPRRGPSPPRRPSRPSGSWSRRSSSPSPGPAASSNT